MIFVLIVLLFPRGVLGIFHRRAEADEHGNRTGECADHHSGQG